MFDDVLTALTIATVIGCALMAGVFFAFSAFVMQALSRMPPAQGIAAMQSINITVLAPWFLSVFCGTAVCAAIVGAAALLELGELGAVLRLAGSLLYLVGVIVVTGACNVPRNDHLAAIDPGAVESIAIWNHFVSEWTRWNTVRTLAAIAAAAAFAAALKVD